VAARWTEGRRLARLDCLGRHRMFGTIVYPSIIPHFLGKWGRWIGGFSDRGGLEGSVGLLEKRATIGQKTGNQACASALTEVVLFRFFFHRQDLQRQVAKLAQQGNILLEVSVTAPCPSNSAVYCSNLCKRCLILLTFSFIPLLHHLCDVSFPIALQAGTQVPVLAPDQRFQVGHGPRLGSPQPPTMSGHFIAEGKRCQVQYADIDLCLLLARLLWLTRRLKMPPVGDAYVLLPADEARAGATGVSVHGGGETPAKDLRGLQNKIP